MLNKASKLNRLLSEWVSFAAEIKTVGDEIAWKFWLRILNRMSS